MSTTSNVVPHEFTSSTTVTSFTIQNCSVQIFKGAMIDVLMWNQNGTLYKFERVDIDQEEYLQWNNDDTYIVDLVATKLGLTVEPTPDIPVPVPVPDIPVPVPVPDIPVPVPVPDIPVPVPVPVPEPV
jgi:hypothetical protein